MQFTKRKSLNCAYGVNGLTCAIHGEGLRVAMRSRRDLGITGLFGGTLAISSINSLRSRRSGSGLHV